jgi:CHASE3 domain sensor protein
MGISPSELSARVATLDSATLDRLAQRTAASDPALAGGDTVTISVTLLIVALLVLIILLVA